MITISILNNKGGTAKTTSTTSIGSVLADKGFKVLLIDLDEQCNLTNTLFEGEVKTTIYDSYKKYIDGLPVEKINDNLCLVPASERLNSLEVELATSIARDKMLSRLLQKYADYFDYCLIDCPPAKNTLTLNALIASNFVLIPAEAEPFAYKGVVAINELVKEVKEYHNPDLEILGAFIAKSNTRRTIAKTIKDAISMHLKGMLFESDIRIDVAIPESQAEKKTLIEYAPESKAAKDYLQLTEEILKKTNNK